MDALLRMSDFHLFAPPAHRRSTYVIPLSALPTIWISWCFLGWYRLNSPKALPQFPFAHHTNSIGRIRFDSEASYPAWQSCPYAAGTGLLVGAPAGVPTPCFADLRRRRDWGESEDSLVRPLFSSIRAAFRDIRRYAYVATRLCAPGIPIMGVRCPSLRPRPPPRHKGHPPGEVLGSPVQPSRAY